MLPNPVPAPETSQPDAPMALAPWNAPERATDATARAQATERFGSQVLAEFVRAVDHRRMSGVSGRMVDCQRQRQGKYDPEKLAQIRAMGGSELYFNITAPKCQALESWIGDVLGNRRDKPWMLEATPIR